MVDEFNKYGYKEDVINQEIEYLIKENLIETDKIISDISWTKLPNNDFSITISAKGHYYVSELVNRFHYFELVLQDTPIGDQKIFNDIQKEFPIPEKSGKKDLSVRVKIVEMFIEYLRSCITIYENSDLCNKYGNMVENILANGLDKDLKRIKILYND